MSPIGLGAPDGTGSKYAANSQHPRYGCHAHWPRSARRRNVSANFPGLSSCPRGWSSGTACTTIPEVGEEVETEIRFRSGAGITLHGVVEGEMARFLDHEHGIRNGIIQMETWANQDVARRGRAHRDRAAAEEITLMDGTGARADMPSAAEAADADLASAARFRAVQDVAPFGFAIHRPVRERIGGSEGSADGRVIDFSTPYINEAGARLLGRERAAIMAGTLLTLFPGTSEEGVFADYLGVLTTGVSAHRELLYERDHVAAGLAITAVRIGDGDDAEVGVTFLDVTERLRAEAERDRVMAALDAERERLRTIIAEAPIPMALLTGPEHRLQIVNAACQRIIAGGRDVTGLTVAKAIPELAKSVFVEVLDRVYATGEPWTGPETLVRYDRDGTGIMDTWFNLHYRPVRDDSRQVTGIIIVTIDITDQVVARREVELARAAAVADQQRLAAVIAHLPVGVTFAEGPAGQHSISNPAAVALWGVVPASSDVAAYSHDFIGFRPGPGTPGSAEEGARRIASDEWPLARALTTGELVQHELAEIERPDGTRRWVSLSAAPVRDVDGRVVGAIVTTVDVTERERLLVDAQAARSEAEAANRAKGEFLAVMSHELRTPLNAIGGYTELIELGIHGPVTEAQRTALARIQASQRHLLGLISAVLDYSRVEAGAVSYRIVNVPVGEAVSEAETLVAPQLRAKGLGYGWSGTPPTLEVQADREKLQQVLLNLLGNAVKFTGTRDGVAGRVEVTCTVNGTAAGGRALLHVHDTGAGIPAEQLERVFEPFVQADQKLTRPQQGVGLGLAISRDLARGMGGDLTVESTPGVGSTFTLSLPRA